MRRTYAGSFPGGPNAAIVPNQPGNIIMLQDTPQLVQRIPQWSSGATAAVQAALQGPAPQQKWSLLSVTVNGYLGLTSGGQNGVTNNQPFGKLGKIYAAVDPSSGSLFGGFVSGNSQQPWSVVAAPQPSDSTLRGTVWDPASDPLPPWAPFYFTAAGYTAAPLPSALLPVSVTIIPPIPVQLVPQIQPAIGIWMEQSLLGILNAPGAGLGFTGLTLFYANYTINYDDGA